jgi:hypothetical protein
MSIDSVEVTHPLWGTVSAVYEWRMRIVPASETIVQADLRLLQCLTRSSRLLNTTFQRMYPHLRTIKRLACISV